MNLHWYDWIIITIVGVPVTAQLLLRCVADVHAAYWKTKLKMRNAETTALEELHREAMDRWKK